MFSETHSFSLRERVRVREKRCKLSDHFSRAELEAEVCNTASCFGFDEDFAFPPPNTLLRTRAAKPDKSSNTE